MWWSTYSQTYPGVKREDIWQIWKDVNNWAAWHDDLDYCKLAGEFAVGNHFMLKPKNMKPVKIMITEMQEGYSFTDCTQFFGAKMYNTHSMKETPDGLEITNVVKVTGILKSLWVALVARKVANSIPDEMGNLVDLARQKHG
jgi:hypothetical protein